ncbi:hypothetical protein BDW22DRAFT_976154 [Trametopsis cervina]|nr:hypothetical protein BDW22DRAFT_976154 [Trametopsis cervina]
MRPIFRYQTLHCRAKLDDQKALAALIPLIHSHSTDCEATNSTRKPYACVSITYNKHRHYSDVSGPQICYHRVASPDVERMVSLHFATRPSLFRPGERDLEVRAPVDSMRGVKMHLRTKFETWLSPSYLVGQIASCSYPGMWPQYLPTCCRDCP